MRHAASLLLVVGLLGESLAAAAPNGASGWSGDRPRPITKNAADDLLRSRVLAREPPRLFDRILDHDEPPPPHRVDGLSTAERSAGTPGVLDSPVFGVALVLFGIGVPLLGYLLMRTRGRCGPAAAAAFLLCGPIPWVGYAASRIARTDSSFLLGVGQFDAVGTLLLAIPVAGVTAAVVAAWIATALHEEWTYDTDWPRRPAPGAAWLLGLTAVTALVVALRHWPVLALVAACGALVLGVLTWDANRRQPER
ncbi:MAG: hypothetical protein CMJ58_27505 [Planctomycetaceae bacterium]|nr:hypothetical protein [Planctomycetaceae bacterium]